VIVAKYLPSEGKDRVEFEEVAGPDPSPPQELKHGLPEFMDIMFVAPYPIPPSEA